MPGQQAIRTGLVALPNRAVQLKGLGDPVQAAVEGITEPHHVLDVVNFVSEKEPENFQEVVEASRQVPAGEDLDQVPEIVGAVKRDPADGVVTEKTGWHEQVGEPGRVDAVLGVPLEVDPLAFQEVDGIGSVGVTRQVEIPEVELPNEGVGGTESGEVAVGVGEGEADLDKVQNVDVWLEETVVVGGASARWIGGRARAEDDAGKLRIHGNERESMVELSDEAEFVFQIEIPNLTDLDLDHHGWSEA